MGKFVSEKKICYLLIFLFILSLVPLYIISFYAHPSGDDYWYGELTRRAVVQGGNVFDVIKAACNQVKESYTVWQGTFTAIFLMTLQPAVFSESLYFLTTFILLTALIASTLFFTKIVMIDFFRANRYEWLIVSIVLLTLSIQFLPSPLQAFYWYNGGLYYTAFHALMLTLFGILLRFARRKKSSKGTIITICLASFCCFLIGGGNYVTALITCIGMALYLFVTCFAKDYRQRKSRWVLLPFVILLVSFLFSIMSPGNSVRHELNVGLSAPVAILKSFYTAVQYINQWTNLPMLIAVSFVIPFFWKIANQSSFSFPYPLIISVLSFCLFSALFTPTLYAMNNVGDDRLVDLYYYSYLLMVFWNAFYWVGWMVKKLSERIDSTVWVLQWLRRYAALGFVSLAMCFIISVMAVYPANSISSVSAAYSLVNGQAKEYRRQYEIRLEQYLNPDVEDVEVKPFTVTPRLLHYPWMEAIKETPDGGQNQHLQSYYDKQSVIMR